MIVTKVCRDSGESVQIGTCGPYVADNGWGITVTEPMRRLRRGEAATPDAEIATHTFRLGYLTTGEPVIVVGSCEPVEWLRGWRATEQPA
jgi:hypothetical protein